MGKWDLSNFRQREKAILLEMATNNVATKPNAYFLCCSCCLPWPTTSAYHCITFKRVNFRYKGKQFSTGSFQQSVAETFVASEIPHKSNVLWNLKKNLFIIKEERKNCWGKRGIVGRRNMLPESGDRRHCRAFCKQSQREPRDVDVLWHKLLMRWALCSVF